MKGKILIVDDAMFMRRVIRKALESNGYENIVEAADGQHSLESFRIEQPDLVLLDITMPDMSGLDVLEKILQSDPMAKVIMCSALGQESVVQKALGTGALDFAVKPFKPEVLMKIVDYHMQNQESGK